MTRSPKRVVTPVTILFFTFRSSIILAHAMLAHAMLVHVSVLFHKSAQIHLCFSTYRPMVQFSCASPFTCVFQSVLFSLLTRIRSIMHLHRLLLLRPRQNRDSLTPRVKFQNESDQFWRQIAHILLFANNVGFQWNDNDTRAYIGSDDKKIEVPNPYDWPGSLNDFKDMLFRTAWVPPFQRATLPRLFELFGDKIREAEQREEEAVASSQACAKETVVSINNVPNGFASQEFIWYFIDFVFDSIILKSCAVQIKEGDEPHLKQILLSWNYSNSRYEAEIMWWTSFLVKVVDSKQCGSAVITAYSECLVHQCIVHLPSHDQLDTRTKPTHRPGNQCFINASITALFACGTICEILRSLLDGYNALAPDTQEASLHEHLQKFASGKVHPKPDDMLLGSPEACLVHSFAAARSQAELGTPFTPWLMWHRFYKGYQEDVHEFLGALVDEDASPRLHSCLQGTLHPNWICQNCSLKTPLTGFEKFTTLPIDIVGEISLQRAVDAFFSRKETVDLNGVEWVCPGCKIPCPAKKQNAITKCPQLLLIQLKRFSTAFQVGQPATINYEKHYVECEKHLRIQQDLYILRAKIYHQGDSMEIGHYYTICYHKLPQGSWWYYNDTQRRVVRPTDNNPPDARVYLCLYEMARNGEILQH